jgi:putative ABC transport system ATP-binding protein
MSEAAPLDSTADAGRPAAADRPPLVRVQHIAKSYTDGKVTALVDVSLEIHRGEYLAIVGKSGSGKSTLLNMLGALDRPSSGEVYFQGQPLSQCADLDRFRSQHVGFVFQAFNLLPILTALENVQVPMFETGRSAGQRQARALELLEMVGIAHRARHLPKALSIGERQRVAIARALANDPPLLLADEPTGNLDSQTAEQIVALFERLHSERGTTLVLVTHDRDLARRAQRVLRMQDGRISSEAIA